MSLGKTTFSLAIAVLIFATIKVLGQLREIPVYIQHNGCAQYAFKIEHTIAS